MDDEHAVEKGRGRGAAESCLAKRKLDSRVPFLRCLTVWSLEIAHFDSNFTIFSDLACGARIDDSGSRQVSQSKSKLKSRHHSHRHHRTCVGPSSWGMPRASLFIKTCLLQ
eukprot:7166475-Prymnesium_polylepis.1